jgi:hypothetical protein
MTAFRTPIIEGADAMRTRGTGNPMSMPIARYVDSVSSVPGITK